MKNMWKILQKKVDDRAKRVLAAWLGVCLVLHLVFSGLAPIGSYASDTQIKKVDITLTEQQIRKALQRKDPVEDWEDIKVKIPYKEPNKRQAAQELLEEKLLRMTIIKKSSNADYSYVVAASCEDPEDVTVPIEEITLIGLNGSKDKNVFFTLQIVDENGMVIKSLTAMGYRWGGDDAETATGSEATGSEATASEASASDVDSDEILAATISEAEEATVSDADEEKETDLETGDVFVEYYKNVMEGEQLRGLIIAKADRPTALSADVRSFSSLPSPPAIRAGVGEIVVGTALKDERSDFGGDVGTILTLNVEADKAEINTGEFASFEIRAGYSNIAENMTAYMAIDFEIDGLIEAELDRYLTGPESPDGTKVSDEDEEWKIIKTLIDGEYQAGQSWYKIASGEVVYYYCPSIRKAVFGKKNGSTGASMKIPFHFANGITPDGVTITAKPSLLNENEIINSYIETYRKKAEDANSPGQEIKIPEWEDVKKGIDVGTQAEIVNRAKFQWVPVQKNIIENTLIGRLENGKKTLGNLWTASSKTKIGYNITARPDHEDNTSSGVLFTEKIQVKDTFQIKGLSLKEGYNSLKIEKGSNNLYKARISNGSDTRDFLDFTFGSSVNPKNFSAELINNPNVIEVEITYELTNDELKQDLQLNGGSSLKVESNFYFLLSNLKILKLAPEKGKPEITNTVQLDAYSVMYDASMTEEEKSAHHHHSEASTTVYAAENYPITKKAYTDENCEIEAIEEKGVFEPEKEVYYQISAANHGYTDENFDITDQLPDGIESAELQKLALIDSNKTTEQMPELPHPEQNGDVIRWNNILVPAGNTAVLTIKAKIKNAEAFNPQTNNVVSSTKLQNIASWYKASDREQLLSNSSATVYVSANQLTSAQLELKKLSTVTNQSQLVVGSPVGFNLTARLTEKADYSQNVTMTDVWPKSVTFTGVKNLKLDGYVVLKKENGDVIGSYTNTGAEPKGAPTLSNFKNIKGGSLKEEDVKDLYQIEVTVFVDKSDSVSTMLLGKINQEGQVTNKITAGDGVESDPVNFYAINMAIEKKAYHIAQSYVDSIDKDTPFEGGTETFHSGDVVFYEITMTNKTSQNGIAIQPKITDDVGSLFTDQKGEAIAAEYATASLDGNRGSVFYRIGSDPWNVMEAPTDGKIKINLETLDKKIEKGQSCTVRIYLKVPEKAVGSVTRKFTNTAKAVLTLGGREFEIPSTADINTLENREQKASITKKIYAVGKEIERPNGEYTDKPVYMYDARWYSKDIPSGSYKGYAGDTDEPKVNKGDYIFYKIDIKNEGTNPLNIYEIEDQLPDGVEFYGFFEFSGGKNGKIAAVGDNKLQLNCSHWLLPMTDGYDKNLDRWLYYTDGTDAPATVFFKNIDEDKSGSSGTMYIKGTKYRARVYDKNDKTKTAAIKAGKAITFGIIGHVTQELDENVSLINTAGVVINSDTKPSGVSSSDDVRPIQWIGSEIVGGYTYPENAYKVLTDTAEASGSLYTPGIEKQFLQYQGIIGWTELDNGILPNNPMRWKITLHNGTNGMSTAGPIEAYEIKDTLPDGMKYNDQDPATFLLDDGTEVALPEPIVSDDQSEVSWKISKVRIGNGYQIEGAKKISTEKDLSIPAGGTIALRIGTSPASEDGTARYGSYTNQADLILSERLYAYEEASIGKVIAEPKSVHAVAKVDIFGAGKTESWKEISSSYDGVEYVGSGDTDDNCVIADAGSQVTYTLKVKNQAGNASLRDLVVIDHLPDVNDHGIVSNPLRDSDFKVTFADQPDVTVAILDESNTEVEGAEGDYKVLYASWKNIVKNEGSALPSNQWKPGAGGAWNEDSKGADTIRIEFGKDFLEKVKSNYTVSVSFKGQLPKAAELENLNGAIAWNSFGYSYGLEGKSYDIVVEPAKVGVQIPTARVKLTKEVESPITDDLEKEFSFLIEMETGELGKFEPLTNASYKIDGITLNTDENGVLKLKKDQTAELVLLANLRYRITELDANGFTVKTTNFTAGADGGFVDEGNKFEENKKPTIESGKLEKDEIYYVKVLNTKKNLVLPETGGSGIRGFRYHGALIIAISIVLLASFYVSEDLKKRKREEDEYEN